MPCSVGGSCTWSTPKYVNTRFPSQWLVLNNWPDQLLRTNANNSIGHGLSGSRGVAALVLPRDDHLFPARRTAFLLLSHWISFLPVLQYAGDYFPRMVLSWSRGCLVSIRHASKEISFEACRISTTPPNCHGLAASLDKLISHFTQVWAGSWGHVRPCSAAGILKILEELFEEFGLRIFKIPRGFYKLFSWLREKS